VPFLIRRRRGGGGGGGDGDLMPPQDFENAAMVTSWPAQTDVYGGGSHPSRPAPPMHVPLQAPDFSPPRGQAQVQFCTQCGMRLGHNHRFCGFCGHASDAP